MLKLVISAAFVCAATVHGTACALAADLTAPELNELLAGATIELDTPVGTRLPVSYGRDGKLLGHARDLAWYLGAPVDRGQWWVAGGQICHRWDRWFERQEQCLKVRKEGRLLHWRRQDGTSGTATLTVPAPKLSPPLLASVWPERPKLLALPKVASRPAHVPDYQEAGGVAVKVPLALTEKQPSAGQEPSAPQAKAPTPDSAADRAKPAGKDPAPSVSGTAKSDAPRAEKEPKGQSLGVYRVANVRSDDVLNIRSGPSADFAIVGSLPPGTRGIAITSACRSQWCPVKHNSASGWVNRAYLAPESAPEGTPPAMGAAERDSPQAPRACLAPAMRALLARIEQRFGPVQVISTCRPGATIRGTWRPSRHATGNAVDFKAGGRKAEIIAWLVANHKRGGTMTYAGMDHIHVDIGPHFVSIVGGPRWASWREGRAGLPPPQ